MIEYEHNTEVENDFKPHFAILMAIILLLLCTHLFLKNYNKPQPLPTVNQLTIFRPIIVESDTIHLQRATTYWCDTSQCDSNPFTTADGSVIDPNNPQRWVALSRDLLHRWGGEFHYGDTIEIYSKEHPNVNGYWVAHDAMNAKYEMSIDFLMHPKDNYPKLGIGTDCKIIYCGNGL